jgi:hypothetical protein
MSDAPIPRAVELVAILLIPKEPEDLEAIKKGIVSTDGIISGPRLNGRVIRAHLTGDFGSSGRLSTVTQINILTYDGAEILMIDRGEWWGSNGALARMLANELVAPGESYLIGVAKFETSHPRYAWLNNGQFLSHAVGDRNRLKMSVYRAARGES